MKGYCRNEVTAREGIDTAPGPDNSYTAFLSRNEVTAREGIDTLCCTTPPTSDYGYRRNEVTAREGIDTRRNLVNLSIRDYRRNEVTAREGIDTYSMAAFNCASPHL